MCSFLARHCSVTSSRLLHAWHWPPVLWQKQQRQQQQKQQPLPMLLLQPLLPVAQWVSVEPCLACGDSSSSSSSTGAAQIWVGLLRLLLQGMGRPTAALTWLIQQQQQQQQQQQMCQQGLTRALRTGTSAGVVWRLSGMMG
jgi:hypothetical protein